VESSARRAWLLLTSLNTSFREPAAVLAKGGRGGARLTAFGRALIRIYREFDDEIQVRAARRFRPILRHTRSQAGVRGKSVPVKRLKDR
jgi:molybdate transport system regulatory protein